MKHEEMSRTKAILKLKCPACRKGDLFKPVAKISDLFEMHENCPECEQPYEIEIGFYWGAMYVAYALSSGVCLTSAALFIFGFKLSINAAFALMIVLMIPISPYIFRLARSIWLHAFVNKRKHN